MRLGHEKPGWRQSKESSARRYVSVEDAQQRALARGTSACEFLICSLSLFGWFPILGVPYWSPYYKGILPFWGSILMVPYFRIRPHLTYTSVRKIRMSSSILASLNRLFSRSVGDYAVRLFTYFFLAVTLLRIHTTASRGQVVDPHLSPLFQL